MKNKNRFVTLTLYITAVFLLFLPGDVSAQNSGYDILNLDVSARSSGMGGAFVGIDGDLHALFYNPAGLAAINKRTASVSFLDHVLDINSGNAVTVFPRGETVYAAGISYINYGDFEGRDEFGNDTGSFSAQDVVLTGGLSRKYTDNIYYGVGSKVMYSKIESFSSTAIAADAGVMYVIPEQMLTIGLSLANIGYVAQAYDETRDDLPMVVKAGFSKRLAHLPFLMSLEFRQFFDGESQIVGGGEFTFSDYFKGRFGYNSYVGDQKIGDEGGTLSGFSFGIGLYWKKYVIDYAFTSMGIIGNLNRLTLAVPF